MWAATNRPRPESIRIMRLFEAILEANTRAVNGDANAGIHLADYADELPVVAMTCIDPRLNRLFPGVMGLPADGFIWLRNAGNVIFGPLSSMTRSLSLACAIKGGREIAIIGHTDCQVCRTTIPALIEKYRAQGVERSQLPENLAEYFGVFSSERQNVIQSTEYVRSSPLIGPRVAVQGLMVDVNTGKLEWVVNGYETMGRRSVSMAGLALPGIGNLNDQIGQPGEIKMAETKIGELATEAKHIVESATPLKIAPTPAAPAPKPATPPPIPAHARNIPVPPPIRMHPRGGKT